MCGSRDGRGRTYLTAYSTYLGRSTVIATHYGIVVAEVQAQLQTTDYHVRLVSNKNYSGVLFKPVSVGA